MRESARGSREKSSKTATAAFYGEPCTWKPRPGRSRCRASPARRAASALPTTGWPRHLTNEFSKLRRDCGTASACSSAPPGPVKPEAFPVPPDDRFRFHEGERVPPTAPGSGQQDPEHPISHLQPWPLGGPLKDHDLVTQREVLQDQGMAGPERQQETFRYHGHHAGHGGSAQAQVQC